MMRLLDRILTGRYWIVYYLTYLASFGLLAWYYRIPLQWRGEPAVEPLYLLAAVFAVAAGTATLAAVFFEVTGRMVLLIPAAWRKAKAEGHAEGLAEGRQSEHNRVRSILTEQGRHDPATGVITLSPVAAARLLNGAGEP